MRPLLLLLLIALAAPAHAQWERVPLPPQVVSPAQVAIFGFAEAFGGSLFVTTGFGIPQTPSSPVYEYVFVTHDGGATWAPVPEFTFNITNSALRLGRPTVADGALYIPRETIDGNPTPEVRFSTVLKTTDGTAWTTPAAAGYDPMDGVIVNVARQDGALVGHSAHTATTTSGSGYVYRSADDGATWTRAGDGRTPGFIYAAGARLLLGFGAQSTSNGERSADGGATWTPHGSQIFAFGRNSAGVVLTGALFNVQRSTDGGVTFAPIPSTTFGFGGTMALGACGSAFVALAAGVVKRSDDGGTTWAPWSEGLPDSGTNVLQFSCSAGGPAALAGTPAYVYAAVSGNSSSTTAGVYRRDLAQMPVADEAAPETLAAALSAAPNPTRRAATLQVTLAEAQAVHISVTDALGREVLTLDRTLAAGAHVLPLDVSGLAPGVYVARLVGAAESASVRITVAR